MITAPVMMRPTIMLPQPGSRSDGRDSRRNSERDSGRDRRRDGRRINRIFALRHRNIALRFCTVCCAGSLFPAFMVATSIEATS